MPKFVQKAVQVEAFQITEDSRENESAWPDWVRAAVLDLSPDDGDFVIRTNGKTVSVCSSGYFPYIYEPASYSIPPEKVGLEPAKFTRKPKIVDAFQVTEESRKDRSGWPESLKKFDIVNTMLRNGDWVFRYPNGRVGACSNEVFSSEFAPAFETSIPNPNDLISKYDIARDQLKEHVDALQKSIPAIGVEANKDYVARFNAAENELRRALERGAEAILEEQDYLDTLQAIGIALGWPSPIDDVPDTAWDNKPKMSVAVADLKARAEFAEAELERLQNPSSSANALHRALILRAERAERQRDEAIAKLKETSKNTKDVNDLILEQDVTQQPMNISPPKNDLSP